MEKISSSKFKRIWYSIPVLLIVASFAVSWAGGYFVSEEKLMKKAQEVIESAGYTDVEVVEIVGRAVGRTCGKYGVGRRNYMRCPVTAKAYGRDKMGDKFELSVAFSIWHYGLDISRQYIADPAPPADDEEQLLQDVGQPVQLRGRAQDVKSGAVLITRSTLRVYVDGLDYWPDGFLAEEVLVSGVLQYREFIPGEEKQFVIENAKWEKE
ncbi:MAG: hypothetical protein AAB588_01715 [Patescibacteria group bacterium]